MELLIINVGHNANIRYVQRLKTFKVDEESWEKNP
jgi:hypothetical protein